MAKNKKSKKCNCSPLLVTLTVLVIALAASTGYLFFTRKTKLDEKKIQAFESLAASSIHSGDFTENSDNITVKTLEIGVTKDNDLYIDFIYISFDNDHLPIYRQKGRVHYQCNNNSGKVIGQENDPEGCSRAYNWEDQEFFSEETRNAVKNFIDKNNEYIEKIYAISEKYCPSNEDSCSLTEEQKEARIQEMKALDEEYKEINGDELEKILWQ